MKYSVKIISNRRRAEFKVEKDANLLSVLQTNDYNIYAPCAGNGTCSKCKVQLKDIGSVLSCQYGVQEDITVIVPDKLEMEVLVSQYSHTLTVPFIPDQTSMMSSYPLGLAIDIGTTTIAFYQVNLITGVLQGIKSAVNHQATFGADVISRIFYCAENEGGIDLLQRTLIVQINEYLQVFAEENGVDPAFFTKIMIAGNNTMLHLLHGVDPKPLAHAPFTPEFTDHQLLNAQDLGLVCHADAEVHLLPSISAYVGSDIVAGIASLANEGEKPYLFIDIGTNGEMALVMKEKIWCCATAAGPAFEGANISCGSGAIPGAINTFSERGYTTIGYAKPSSICGSGLIDIVSLLLDQSKISADGTMEEDFVVSAALDNAFAEDISLTQQDIREVQLAKGAIAAGMSILMKRAGLDYSDITHLYVAGGFGNYMNMDSAFNIGLLPVEMKGKTELIGNAAGTGALLALKSTSFLKRIEESREKTEYIELSYDADFTVEFAMKMYF
jgi:uncharacterized 2Fe-2S/4Fe-4S cluster protein (DUF4445 family)